MILVMISYAERDRRLSVCSLCQDRIVTTIPFSKRSIIRCGRCGCVLAVRALISKMKCPIGKW